MVRLPRLERFVCAHAALWSVVSSMLKRHDALESLIDVKAGTAPNA